MGSSPAQRTAEFLVMGAVQGIGFRPHVYRLAHTLALSGWVQNDPAGVRIRVSGSPPQLAGFRRQLVEAAPPACRIEHVQETAVAEALPAGPFFIKETDARGAPATTQVLPDLALCEDCRRELNDPANRRYRYPFINCTHCGPRFSIIRSIPYDRPGTTMCDFPLCPACRAEYEDPLDRRFHAQPIACPDCGPQLAWWDADGRILASREEALQAAVAAIRDGCIVAVKGLGGFHLFADARKDEAILALRARKHREEKPFALMMKDLEQVRRHGHVNEQEQALLAGVAAPIVLLEKKLDAPEPLSSLIAPGQPCLGVMLPYTPLHHLLLAELDGPVVATSANLSDEPICIDEQEALARLRGIADFFLVHDRPIARPVDDSIVRLYAGHPVILRRSRGYAPLPIRTGGASDGETILATGAHLKNTVALAAGAQVFLSQHHGDLETEPSYRAFGQSIESLASLLQRKPVRVACDLHPGYASTRHAVRNGLPVFQVQHHHAHIAAVMAEHGLDGEVFGIAWDGTGYGDDGCIWGGEFLRATRGSFQRLGHLRYFPLPGGEQAVREPRRSALGLLQAWGNPAHTPARVLAGCFTVPELETLERMMARKLNSPLTSSMGRLFDAVACFCGLAAQRAYEGQAAMALEYAALQSTCGESYAFGGAGGDADWAPVLESLLQDTYAGVSAADRARKFHRALVALIVRQATAASLPRVALSGGCFQNKLLLEMAVEQLLRAGFEPWWNRQVPPNDGGIALGQAIVAWTNRERVEVAS